VPVTFHIPGPLRSFTGGESRVEVPGTPATLREALELLWLVLPAIRDRVVTEQGEVREHINLFVGAEDIRYTGGLGTRVSAASEITIVPAISGG
jgi:sulfur-carrier protein